MKYLFFVNLIAVLFTASCQASSSNSKLLSDTLNIHFQGGFEGDSVLVYRNHSLVFNEVLETNDDLGFADEFAIPEYEPKDSIQIVLLKSGKKYTLSLKDLKENFVAIWFSRMDGLRYHTKNSFFIYE